MYNNKYTEECMILSRYVWCVVFVSVCVWGGGGGRGRGRVCVCVLTCLKLKGICSSKLAYVDDLPGAHTARRAVTGSDSEPSVPDPQNSTAAL